MTSISFTNKLVLVFKVDIVVGTPGRMEDLISGGQLSLAQCRFFVLDEADGLLKQGYTDLIDRLHRQMPKITSDGKRLQMIVCSATLHAFEVKKMAVSFIKQTFKIDPYKPCYRLN